jgi:peptidoglycan/xylan/chitin deacetylase (PgdA/CDA1 family)
MHDLIGAGLRAGKRAGLDLAMRTGALERLTGSRWRRRRLLVLCYHGISLEDEHEWNPALYVTASFLRRRLELLKRGGYNVLPLGEALARLYARDLPPRAVALTFDDGYQDFCEAAWPILREFELPATVYLSTARCDYGLPVFNLAVPLMLWRRRGAVYDATHLDIGRLDLRTTQSRREAWVRIQGLATRVTVGRKHQIAQEVSDAIRGGYDELTRRRIVTIMRPADVTRLTGEGVCFELHTHRHRTPRDRDAFRLEIATNRRRIAELTGRTATHFCYPSGVYAPEFLGWLREESVVSATTCDPGIASPNNEPLLLPRLVDHPGLTASEFEAWLTGLPSLFARKAAAHRPPPSLPVPRAGTIPQSTN